MTERSTHISRLELPTLLECRDMQDVLCAELPLLCNPTIEEGGYSSFAFGAEATRAMGQGLILSVKSSKSDSNTYGGFKFSAIGAEASKDESIRFLESCKEAASQDIANNGDKLYGLQKLLENVIFDEVGAPLRYQDNFELAISVSHKPDAPCAIEVLKMTAVTLVNSAGEPLTSHLNSKLRLFSGRHQNDHDTMLDDRVLCEDGDELPPSITRSDFHGIMRIMGRFGLLTASRIQGITTTLGEGVQAGILADPGKLLNISWGHSFNGLSSPGQIIEDEK